MNDFNFCMQTRIIFGRDAELKIIDNVKAFGAKKILLHHSGGSSVRSGLVKKVSDALSDAGLLAFPLDGVVPNPRVALVREGIALCKANDIDFVLAVGGGSVIDSAKAIAVGSKYDYDVWDIFLRKETPSDSLPLGAILTIPAAGSETSDSMVITGDKEVKRGYSGDFFRPVFAALNPVLCATLPKKQIALGITDIMMHTLERFLSADTDNYLTDKIALSVLETAVKFGPAVYRDPSDYKAVSELMWAGSVSHNGLTGLGNTFDLGVHALGHELSAEYDIAHGASLSALFGSFERYVAAVDPSRFAALGRELWGIDEPDDKKAAFRAIDQTVDFFRRLDMPINIPEAVGKPLPAKLIKRMADSATYFGKKAVGRIKSLTVYELEDIYKEANKQ